jgi:hypothetical protein
MARRKAVMESYHLHEHEKYVHAFVRTKSGNVAHSLEAHLELLPDIYKGRDDEVYNEKGETRGPLKPPKIGEFFALRYDDPEQKKSDP